MSKPNDWVVFFDGHAPEYESNEFTHNTVAEVDYLIAELDLRPGAEVLDVGCGTGRHAIELARRGYAVTGLDLSPAMLGEARVRAAGAGVAVRWVQADAAAFDLPEGFDGAICLCEGAFGLLGGSDDAVGQPTAILRNMARALRPGAGCLLTVLNGYRMIRQGTAPDVEAGLLDPLTLVRSTEMELAGTSRRVVLRERGFVPTELVALAELAGLEVVGVWGGTAGNWGRRTIDMDEMELMILARKPPATSMAAEPRMPG